MNPWGEGWNPRMSMSLTSTKGLLNAPGQNNCFLNSAVQVLWHLDVFRRSFRMLSGHACMGNSCIFCALKVLFTQFQYSDQTSLPPDALRKALAKAFMEQQRFQMGLMDDAAECFENILLRIHFHIANRESEDMCNARHCIPHQKFAMTVVEQIVCQCGATSEPLPFSQMVYYVSASALVSEVKSFESQGSLTKAHDVFGQLIRNAVSGGDVRECPSNCGRKVQIRRNLTNCPDVVSLGLVWDSDRPSLEHIKDVVRCIGTSLRLPDLFHSATEDSWTKVGSLQLVGVVCYYGKHYSTFFFHSKRSKWVYFDDATVKEMGSNWHTVADKCCRGHYQPLLLLYANPNSTPISVETAPQITTMLPGYKFFNSPEEPGSQHQTRRSQEEASGGYGTSSRQQYISHETSLRNDVSTTPVSLLRRSRTPNPELSSERTDHHIPRRAITPGPTWGHYDSDEEEYGRQVNTAHFRQSSYLTAMENASGHSESSHMVPSSGMSQPHSNVYSRATAPPMSMNSMVAREGQNIPSGQNFQSGRHMQSNTLHAQGQYNQQDYSGIQDYQLKIIPNYNDWVLPGGDVYQENNVNHMQRIEQPGFVKPTAPKKINLSSAKVSEIQSMKRNLPIPPDTAPYRAGDHTMGNHVLNDQGGHYYPRHEMTTSTSHPDFKGDARSSYHPVNLKRTQSLENTTLDEHDGLQSHHRPLNSKARPQSARPYDYGKQRPVVDVTHGQRGGSAVKLNQAPVQQTPPERPNWEEIMGEDPDATYISRKAVENIIQYQKIRSRPANTGPVCNLPPVPPNTKKVADPYAAPARLKETLKVDIPDNTSLRSQTDSGYRSSSSGGDRNSASSASSTSNESPTIDSLKAYGHKDPYKPVFFGTNFEGKSTENPGLGSGSSNAGVRPGHHHLTKIPENLPATIPYDQSPPQLFPGLSDLESDDEMDLIQFSMPHHGIKEGENCDQLCMRAEGLMDKSMACEKDGDLASSLALCTQAVGLLQHALSLRNSSQDSKVHARMKHNACVLRSRSLHRRMTSRKGVVPDDHTSISSVSTEGDSKELELIHLDTGQKDKFQLMREKLGDLYQKGAPPAGGKHIVKGHPQHYNGTDSKTTYAPQYSSDSGYSTQSDTPNSKRLPHSNTDGALHQRTKHRGDPPPADHKVRNIQCDSDQDSNVGVYATLPKKRIPRPQSTPPESEVYQAYLQKQKEAQRPRRGSNENLLQAADDAGMSSGYAPKGNHQRQSASNGSMSKDDIKKLLITEYIEHRQLKPHDDRPLVKPKPLTKPKPEVKSKPVPPPRVPNDSHGCHSQYEDMISQQVKGLTVREPATHMQKPSGHVSRQLLPGGAANHGHFAANEVCHSRDSSTSSTHTLKAHSRENSLSSLGSQSGGTIPPDSHYDTHNQSHYQPYPQNHESSQRPLQQYYQYQGYGYPAPAQQPSGNANPAPQEGHHLSLSQPGQPPAQPPCQGDAKQGCGQVEVERVEIAPKPSVIGRLDRKYHQELERLTAKQFEGKDQMSKGEEYNTGFQVIQKNSKIEISGPADVCFKRPTFEDKPGTSDPGHSLGTFRPVSVDDSPADCTDGSITPTPTRGGTPQSDDWEGPAQNQLPSEPGPPEYTPDPNFPPNKSSKYSPDPDLPPPPPCAYFAADPDQLDGKKPKHKKSSHSSKSRTNKEKDPKLDTKSALSKRKKGHKKKKLNSKKSVTFSDNIILIGTKEEKPPEIDYIAYVNKLQGNIKRHSTSSSSVTSDLMDESASTISSTSGSSVNDGRTGYVSDYDEESDDSAISEGDCEDKVKCNLCHKKYIEMTELYCEVCRCYMSQFQPQTS